ncbi:putative lipoprotein [Myxococcus stipitatus DSM 14675]|uniref:Putative lipoprotein n=1 Tax=Myxococcus stipitatus (strain DSM 14675 / JCM 12634 / Mx s8) TaxID=1278073 RepID=L7U239_MYXSD|nr:matrixin family metalloprotease [Myxococcus stipitatus]AGC41880.1 putative lipoprotein [Myxococcus stipitatus DSM 14675]
MLDFRSMALLAGVSLLGAACGGPGVPESQAPEAQTWEAFRASAVRDSEGVWIFDGDQAAGSEAELRAFYEERVASTGTSRAALAVYFLNGVDVKWGSAQKRNLTYCVSNTFGVNKAAVVAAMNTATADWEATANVDFIHNPAFDASCTASQTGVLFDVRPVNSGGQYLARAFFPNAPRSSRNVLLDNVVFGGTSVWTLEGTLRHELGHVLGFVHEHDRCPGGAGTNMRPLSVYDSASVMHYPRAGSTCVSTNPGGPILSPLDRTGARSLYP